MKQLVHLIKPTLNQKSIDLLVRETIENGLYVLDHSTKKRIPIRIALDSVTVDQGLWRDAISDALHVFKASQKVVSRYYRKLTNRAKFADFSDLEWSSAKLGLPSRSLVCARFDCLLVKGDLRFVELNTTIPAMQGYADILRKSYSKLFSNRTDLSSFESDLLVDSFIRAYRDKNGNDFRSVCILCRNEDAQLGELTYIKKVFESRGFSAEVAHPHQIKIENAKIKSEGGQTFDAVYRHIFLTRLSSNPDIESFCVNSPIVFNPPSAHWEAKIIFAELSEATRKSDLAEEYGLHEDELLAIRKRIPDSYQLDAQKNLDVEHPVSQSVNRFVIKRNRGYGGKDIFFGSDYVSAPQSWVKLIRDQVGDPHSCWVAQEFINGDRFNIRWVDGKGTLSESSCLLDLSIFLYPGAGVFQFGKVARFHEKPVVNLGQGGGLISVHI